MFHLKDLLSDAVQALMGPRRAQQAAVFAAWPEVVGTARARHARTAGIRGNALVVVTDLPALSYEIGLRRAALVEALNRRVGAQAIEDIHIVIRPMDDLGDETV